MTSDRYPYLRGLRMVRGLAAAMVSVLLVAGVTFGGQWAAGPSGDSGDGSVNGWVTETPEPTDTPEIELDELGQDEDEDETPEPTETPEATPKPEDDDLDLDADDDTGDDSDDESEESVSETVATQAESADVVVDDDPGDDEPVASADDETGEAAEGSQESEDD